MPEAENKEFLETGYEETTPAADSFLRRFLLNWGEGNEAITRSLGGSAIRTLHYWAADSGRLASFANAATVMRPMPGDPTDILHDLEQFFAAHDGHAAREVYLFSAWPTPDLRPHGWHLAGHPPLLLLPAGRTPPPHSDRLDIRSVISPDMLQSLERVAIEGYPLPGLTGRQAAGELFGPGLLADPRFRFWLGVDDSKPVSIAITSVNHGINQVELIVTLPEARRRGIGESMTWQASTADPSLPAMLLSSDLGRSVYERMGFLPLFRFTLWFRHRPLPRASDPR